MKSRALIFFIFCLSITGLFQGCQKSQNNTVSAPESSLSDTENFLLLTDSKFDVQLLDLKNIPETSSLMYVNDKNGDKLWGDKSNLTNSILEGKAVRIFYGNTYYKVDRTFVQDGDVQAVVSLPVSQFEVGDKPHFEVKFKWLPNKAALSWATNGHSFARLKGARSLRKSRGAAWFVEDGSSSWRSKLHINRSGKRLSGSVSSLIDSIQRGSKVHLVLSLDNNQKMLFSTTQLKVKDSQVFALVEKAVYNFNNAGPENLPSFNYPCHPGVAVFDTLGRETWAVERPGTCEEPHVWSKSKAIEIEWFVQEPISL